MANNLRTRGEKSFAVFNYIFMTLLCIICIYPLWYVLVASLSDPVLLYMQRGILVWPLGEWSIRGYQLVMENPNIPLGFRNTLIYLGVGTFINMLITTMAAYGLSRKDCYWNGKIMKLIAFTMYFAGGLIPFYLMVKNMNLLDTYSGIILPVMVNTWNLIADAHSLRRHSGQSGRISASGRCERLDNPMAHLLPAGAGNDRGNSAILCSRLVEQLVQPLHLPLQQEQVPAPASPARNPPEKRHFRHDPGRLHRPKPAGTIPNAGQILHHNRSNRPHPHRIPLPAKILCQGRYGGVNQGMSYE